jgi:hypothetical protein
VQSQKTLSKEDTLIFPEPENIFPSALSIEQINSVRVESQATLLAEPERSYPHSSTEPPAHLYPSSVTEEILLLKEKTVSEVDKEQRATLQKQEAQSALLLSHSLAEGHVDSFQGSDIELSRVNYEPQIPSEHTCTEEGKILMESVDQLRSAEQDFAVRIKESKSLHFPLALEEEQVLLKEEHSDVTAMPPNQITEYKKEPKAIKGVQEVQRSDLLSKESLLPGIPEEQRLKLKTQVRRALQAAVASKQPSLLFEWLRNIENVEVKAINLTQEPKHILCTYLVTSAKSLTEELTITIEDIDPQMANLKTELQDALCSIICEEINILTAEDPRIQKGSLIGVQEEVDCFSEPQKVEAITEPEVKSHYLVSKEEVSWFNVESQVKDVGTTTTTDEVASAAVSDETQDETVKPSEGGMEKAGMVKTQEAEESLLEEHRPVILTPLVDTVSEEGDVVYFTSYITNAKDVNWYFEGKLVPSDKKFKCLQDQNTYTLVIDMVNAEEHQGDYVCEASNDSGKTTTSAKLTVGKRGWKLRIEWL